MLFCWPFYFDQKGFVATWHTAQMISLQYDLHLISFRMSQVKGQSILLTVLHEVLILYDRLVFV